MTASHKAAKTRERRPGLRRNLFIWTAVLSLVVVELVFFTWCRVQCVRIGYQIAREDRQQQELSKLQSNLKIELARLKTPGNVSRIAREELSLAMPEPQQIVVVP